MCAQKPLLLHDAPFVCMQLVIVSSITGAMILWPVLRSCAMNGVRFVDNLFSLDRPGIGILLIYMSLEGIFFFLLTLLIEVYTKKTVKFCACTRLMAGVRKGCYCTLFANNQVQIYTLLLCIHYSVCLCRGKVLGLLFFAKGC